MDPIDNPAYTPLEFSKRTKPAMTTMPSSCSTGLTQDIQSPSLKPN